MTMFVHLLVLACACALSIGFLIPPPPPYEECIGNIEKAWKILEKNIMSMEGNIPPLNDSRRHFAEIFYVISYEGKAQSVCDRVPYSEEYQTNLNISAPEAIYNPQTVVDDVKQLIQTFNEKTEQLQKLIHDCPVTMQGCNFIIDKEVKKNFTLYEPQVLLLILADTVASELNENIEEYNKIAEEFSANEFVIDGMDNLEKITLSLSVLYRELYHWLTC